jgi:hypothetical protein
MSSTPMVFAACAVALLVTAAPSYAGKSVRCSSSSSASRSRSFSGGGGSFSGSASASGEHGSVSRSVSGEKGSYSGSVSASGEKGSYSRSFSGEKGSYSGSVSASGEKGSYSRSFSGDVDVHRDIDVDVHHHPAYHPAAVAVTVVAIGTVVHAPPPTYTVVAVNGVTYYQCGTVWYQP